MASRALSALLAISAAGLDSRGAHGLAFDALLAAVPFTAVAALVAYGAWLEQRRAPFGAVQPLLWLLALALVVASCAARSPATAHVPPLGSSALVAALAVLGLKGILALLPYARLALRPVKP
jgi:hypothetical protein